VQEDEDIRWRQRFQNFQSAYRLLGDAIAISHPTEVERAGLIRFFGMTFELSWKLLKDYLEQEGFNVKTPRQVLKQAFQIEIIDDGEVWLNALNARNLTVHIYEEKTAAKVERTLRREYHPAIVKLHGFFIEQDN